VPGASTDRLGQRFAFSTKQTGTQVRDMMNLIAYCDGRCTLLEIAERIDVPMWKVIPVAETMKSQGLLASR